MTSDNSSQIKFRATNKLTYPLNPRELLRKKKAIKRDLLTEGPLIEKRIAILGGSTTSEIREMMELFLLNRGIRPVFYESEFNMYYQDVMFRNETLAKFNPDLIYVHSTNVNILKWPVAKNESFEPNKLIEDEIEFYRGFWNEIEKQYNCPIVQNNFDPPRFRPMGNLEAYDAYGNCLFVNRLNLLFSDEARTRRNLHIHDISWLAANIGLAKWKDLSLWYTSKYAISFEAIPLLANSVASIICAIFGFSKKCLVLDLDNTLWGGVIGDDGLSGIQIGNETPEAEAHRDLQIYIRQIKERGIILAISSKNNYDTAIEGLNHPDNVLKPNDFSVIKANWEPKHQNIRQIAEELNIGINSLLFLDDNAAEREIVRTNEPLVCVPEIGDDIESYISILDNTGEFELVSISQEDRDRGVMYQGNLMRSQAAAKYQDHNTFLESLCMQAHIREFGTSYLERVTQLTNKSNQFNLTTRRYTLNQISEMANDSRWVTLQGRLKDRFGDNGIVSVVAGEVTGSELRIDLWLMSCRVLKRNMEFAMLDKLVEVARTKGVNILIGEFFPSTKNSMVRNFYNELGFECIEDSESSGSRWILSTDNYSPITFIPEIINDY